MKVKKILGLIPLDTEYVRIYSGNEWVNTDKKGVEAKLMDKKVKSMWSGRVVIDPERGEFSPCLCLQLEED